MRILTDNVITRSTMVSDNESLNYPAANLYHNFLNKKWQALTGTANDITITFTGTEDMNCLFLGAYNVDSIDIDLLISSVSQYSTSFSPTYDVDAVYFDQTYSGIDEVVITANLSSGTMYIGGLALGQYYQMPGNMKNHKETPIDPSLESRSILGHSNNLKLPLTTKHKYNYYKRIRTEYDSMKAKYEEVGRGGKVWVDFRAELHTFKAPQYCTWNNFSSTKDLGDYPSWSIEFWEAR